MDPAGLGYVQSLAHPGGAMTGFTFIDPELIGKWMELLKAMAPGLTGAAMIYNPATTPSYDNWLSRHCGQYESRRDPDHGIARHQSR
jgi:putative ABC transport system substrate-binding protein